MDRVIDNGRKMFMGITLCLFSCSCIAGKGHELNSGDSPRPAIQDKIVRKGWERIFFPIIESRISNTTIKDLRNQKIPASSSEIRIWVGFSHDLLQGIIIRRGGGEEEAMYLPSQKTDSNSLESAISLKQPKNGWDYMWKELDALGIYTLPDATDVDADNAYPDAIGVVIEVRTSNLYKAINYNGFMTSDKSESKRVLKIVETLSDEFGVKLY